MNAATDRLAPQTDTAALLRREIDAILARARANAERVLARSKKNA